MGRLLSAPPWVKEVGVAGSRAILRQTDRKFPTAKLAIMKSTKDLVPHTAFTYDAVHLQSA